jgi:hypothetical protein
MRCCAEWFRQTDVGILFRRYVMRLVVLLGCVIAIASGPRLAAAGDAEKLTRIQNEYADVLALSGTARDEILAFARVLQK